MLNWFLMDCNFKKVANEFKLTPRELKILFIVYSHSHPNRLNPHPNFKTILKDSNLTFANLSYLLSGLVGKGFIVRTLDGGYKLNGRGRPSRFASLYGVGSKGRKVLNRYSELMEQVYKENYLPQATDTPDLDRSAILKLLKSDNTDL